MSEWFEGFFEGLYGQVLLRAYDPTHSVAQARLVKRVLGLRKGQRALDIPCGMGRLTLPLARLGVAMTGVDSTAAYLARARRTAKRDALGVRFVRSDMRKIAFDGEFHAAFNWYGSFGYFSDADNLAFCRRVWQALRPGGRFLVEGPNKSWLLEHFRPYYEETVGGVRIVQRTAWNARTGRVQSEWTLGKGSRTERHVVSIWLFNGADIRRLLARAGFRDIRLYGNPPLGRLTRHSRRLIAVGRRPVGPKGC